MIPEHIGEIITADKIFRQRRMTMKKNAALIALMLTMTLTGCSSAASTHHFTSTIKPEAADFELKKAETEEKAAKTGIVLMESKRQIPLTDTDEFSDRSSDKSEEEIVQEPDVQEEIISEPVEDAEEAELYTGAALVDEKVSEEIPIEETEITERLYVANMEDVILFEDLHQNSVQSQSAGYDKYLSSMESLGLISDYDLEIVESIIKTGHSSAPLDDQKRALKNYGRYAFLDLDSDFAPSINGYAQAAGEHEITEIYYSRVTDEYFRDNAQILDQIVNTYGLETGTDARDTITKTMRRVHDRMDYDLGYNHTGIQASISAGKGVCWTFARIYSVLLTLEGIECRYVSGLADSEDTGSGHAWVEANVDGQWMILECTSENTATLFGGSPEWDYMER